GTLEYLVHVYRCATIKVRVAHAIRHQPTSLDKFSRTVNRGQPMPRRKQSNELAICLRNSICSHDQRVHSLVARAIEAGPDVFSLANIEEWGRDTHRMRGCFDFAADAHQGGVPRIGQVRDASKHRYQFFEKLKSLRKQVGGKTTQPRDIAIRMGKVAH